LSLVKKPCHTPKPKSKPQKHFLGKTCAATTHLDIPDDLALSRGHKGVAALGQDLHQVVGEVAAGQVGAADGVRQRVALVDGHGVRDAVARVQHDAGGAAGRVQREDGLDGDVGGRRVEGLEHDLGHLFAVGLGVQRRFGQQDGVVLGRHPQLVVEGVVPDLFHVVPVGDDACWYIAALIAN